MDTEERLSCEDGAHLARIQVGLRNPTEEEAMADTPLMLTAEEQKLLVGVLRAALGDTRVELHHTHFSPEFRSEVQREDKLLRGLLAKLGQPASQGPL
jgi:hypothetical protein